MCAKAVNLTDPHPPSPPERSLRPVVLPATSGLGKTARMTVTVVPIDPTHHSFEQASGMFDEYRSHYGHRPSPDAARAWLHAQLSEQRLSLAVAVDDEGGLVHGFITTTVMPASMMLGTAWSIRDLYVAEPYRRAGVGSRLLQHAIVQARAAGAVRVSLHTEPDNAPALALYTGAGFEPVDGLTLLNLAIVTEAGG